MKKISPYGIIDMFIRITKGIKRNLAFWCYSVIFIYMKTTLLTIAVLGIAFVLMNLSLLIKNQPLETRCSDGDCECSCGE